MYEGQACHMPCLLHQREHKLTPDRQAKACKGYRFYPSWFSYIKKPLWSSLPGKHISKHFTCLSLSLRTARLGRYVYKVTGMLRQSQGPQPSCLATDWCSCTLWLSSNVKSCVCTWKTYQMKGAKCLISLAIEVVYTVYGTVSTW